MLVTNNIDVTSYLLSVFDEQHKKCYDNDTYVFNFSNINKNKNNMLEI
jgi:hypothetical protein